jgi:hypothetical protein
MGAAAVGMAAAAQAQAQELEIEHAAARVVVIPEARRDVAVTVTPGSGALPPLEVRRRGASVTVDGGLRRRIDGCESRDNGGQAASVRVKGVGRVPVSDLPTITARVPLGAEVSSGGAVFGSIGRTDRLDLASASCGDWTVANVNGPLSISLAGSGDVVTGSARGAEVSLAGSGDVRLGQIAGPLEVSIAGSGDVRAASVTGRIEASIAGSGDLYVLGGRSGPLDASIVGSGDVRVDGSVESVDASIMGSGDVRVSSVLSGVSQSILGSGDVIVAGQTVPRRRR